MQRQKRSGAKTEPCGVTQKVFLDVEDELPGTSQGPDTSKIIKAMFVIKDYLAEQSVQVS